MSRPPAALEHLTEQPGPGHTVMGAAPNQTRRRMGACETTPTTNASESGNADNPPHTTRSEVVLAPDDAPPFVGIQLVRPRPLVPRGPRALQLDPSHTAAPPGDYEQRPTTRNRAPTRLTRQRRRDDPTRPLDTCGPHGCRAATGICTPWTRRRILASRSTPVGFSATFTEGPRPPKPGQLCTLWSRHRARGEVTRQSQRRTRRVPARRNRARAAASSAVPSSVPSVRSP
jgi:hypothetical protein